jgi:hypothetical protein
MGLGGGRPQANDMCLTVHVSPLQLGNFSFAPPRQIGKAGEILQVLRKMLDNPFKLALFKKPLSSIAFRQMSYVRNTLD